MSQMGQTRRFSLGRGMSVVPPIAAMFSKFAQQQRFATAEGGYQASDLVRSLPALDRAGRQACHDLALREHRQ